MFPIVAEPVRFRQEHRDAHRHTARDDRDFVNRIRIFEERRDEGVAAFVASFDDLLADLGAKAATF